MDAKNQDVLQGSNVTFPCKANGVPVPLISWTFGGTAIGPSAIGTNNMTLWRVTNTIDEGNYTCSATNCAGITRKIVQLSIDGVYLPWAKQEYTKLCVSCFI